MHSKFVLPKCSKLFLFKKKNPQDWEIHFSVNTFMFRRHSHLHSKRFSNIQKRCTYKFHGARALMHYTCSPGLGGGLFPRQKCDIQNVWDRSWPARWARPFPSICSPRGVTRTGTWRGSPFSTPAESVPGSSRRARAPARGQDEDALSQDWGEMGRAGLVALTG